MNEHQTLYRKYRPQDFTSLVGQDHIRKALSNALATGKISQAYIFAGPRGTGKTSTARILAKALNCVNGPTATPCNACTNCKQITQGMALDVLEIDAASNRGIDQIRELKEKVGFAPVSSKYKVYVIDEVHMLTIEAFNSFLKVLEEPPEHAVFILATTEPHKIPATIHSRCQRYDFRRVTADDIAKRLTEVAALEGIKITEAAVHLIAVRAQGGMRDALSLLEQCSVLADTVTESDVRDMLGIAGLESIRALLAAVGKRDLIEALRLANILYSEGKEAKELITEVAEYLRALLLYETAPAYEEIYLTDTKENFASLTANFTPERIMAAEATLHATLSELSGSLRSKIYVELCLFTLCREEEMGTLAALAQRVSHLEALVAAGNIPTAATLPSQMASAETKRQGESRAELPSSVQAKPLAQTLATKVPPSKPIEEVKTEALATANDGQRTPINCAGASSEASEMWQAVIVEAQKLSKRTLVAFAKNAHPVGIRGNVFQCVTESPVGAQRLMANDYRTIIKGVLSRLTGRELDFSCQQGEVTKQEEPELPPQAQKALDFFGGKLHT